MTQSIGSARSRTEVTQPKQVKSVPKKSKKKAAKNSKGAPKVAARKKTSTKTSKKKTSKKKPTCKPMFEEDFLKRLQDESDSDDEAPPPPKSSPRKKRTGDQIEKDLITKPKCLCDHTAQNPFLCEYAWLTKDYYTIPYLKKKSDAGIAYPTSCAHCKAKFVVGPGATEKDYKVTTAKVVRCCPNALATDHKCEFGLCDCCYVELVMEAEQELQKKTAKDPRASSRGLVKNKRAKSTEKK